MVCQDGIGVRGIVGLVKAIFRAQREGDRACPYRDRIAGDGAAKTGLVDADDFPRIVADIDLPGIGLGGHADAHQVQRLAAIVRVGQGRPAFDPARWTDHGVRGLQIFGPVDIVDVREEASARSEPGERIPGPVGVERLERAIGADFVKRHVAICRKEQNAKIGFVERAEAELRDAGGQHLRLERRRQIGVVELDRGALRALQRRGN